LRFDVGVGSDPSVAAALYHPLWSSRVFVEPILGYGSTSLSAISDGQTVAEYRRTRLGAVLDGGVNLGRLDELRGGISYGWSSASVRIGDPGLPEVDGEDSAVHFKWIHDGQDDAIVPSRGTHVESELRRYLAAPLTIEGTTESQTSEGVSQLEWATSWVRSLTPTKRRRVFLVGGFGTSFNGEPIATEQFALGGPLRMSAYSVGQKRGDHFFSGGAGYLHQMLRLPDFLGGPVFLGGWFEAGSAFDQFKDADLDAHFSSGVIADTLIGPVFLGLSAGIEGDSRFYIGVGKIFR
jgi:NTE family protein